jgi:hypothetical protein
VLRVPRISLSLILQLQQYLKSITYEGPHYVIISTVLLLSLLKTLFPTQPQNLCFSLKARKAVSQPHRTSKIIGKVKLSLCLTN